MIVYTFWISGVVCIANTLLAADPHPVLAAFESHCIQCHGKDGKVKGKVNLLEITDLDALTRNQELLQSLVEVIDFEEMPPEDEPQFPVAQRVTLLKELQALRATSLAGEVAFEPAPIRRMNRFQYNNAVVDLFELNCTVFTLPERMMRVHQNYFKPETGKMDEQVKVGNRPLGKSQMIEPRLAGVAAFPQDLRAEHGYDNQADHLSLSPLLMEALLALGQSITQSPDFGPKYVAIWDAFFLEPRPETDLKSELRLRLEPFLSKAFRRPVAADQLDRYMGYAQRRIEAGQSFTDVMKSVAAATIASPKFLYLYDGSVAAETEGASRITDLELASRLSFFLWGSLPDEALLARAASGDLHTPEALDAEFRRMVTHPKIKRFCDSFPAQWLQLDRMISSIPHRATFPEFYFAKYRASMHMMMEPLLVFETVLIENLPITQFIDSDFTYRSAHLETSYGELGNEAVANSRAGQVAALDFYRRPVTDRRTGGLITTAGVMTMTSGPERTQPITRGAWLAGVIFNNPPKPPPADVPALGEKPPEGEEHLTLRERLSMHRERSDCKGCHEQIDPLGFALENFDPVGRWRSNYENGRDVDMAGTLMRKHSFNNVVEFKDAILAEKDRFARGLAGHLLAFALARELGPADQPALDAIAAATAADGYRMQTLLKQIVLSDPFLHKNPTARPHE